MRRLSLGGADLVLMAMHARWKDTAPSNNALMIVECEGPLAAGRIRQSLDRFLDVCPWPAARLRRPRPWGKLHWAADARARLVPPPVRHRAVATRAALQRELEGELNAPIDPRRDPPLRVLLLDWEPEPGMARGALVLTWFHPLMDPRGAQNLLASLVHLDQHEGASPWGETPPQFVAAPDRRSFRERGRLARRSLDYMRTLSPEPPVSLGTGRAPRGRIRFRQASFAEGDHGAPDRRARREISGRLAVVGKAMAELWDRRGLPDIPFLLPISVDLRPKGEPGPIFGNRLAFHFARFRPSDTADGPALARALRGQLADALRDGQVEANAAAMDFLQYRPLSAMLRALPWASGGDIFSFHCADIADFPAGLGPLFGRRLLNAYHAPAVLPRPGIGVFFNRCEGRNNLVVSWVDAVVSEDDVTRITETVREEMGWIRAS